MTSLTFGGKLVGGIVTKSLRLKPSPGAPGFRDVLTLGFWLSGPALAAVNSAGYHTRSAGGVALSRSAPRPSARRNERPRDETLCSGIHSSHSSPPETCWPCLDAALSPCPSRYYARSAWRCHMRRDTGLHSPRAHGKNNSTQQRRPRRDMYGVDTSDPRYFV